MLYHISCTFASDARGTRCAYRESRAVRCVPEHVAKKYVRDFIKVAKNNNEEYSIEVWNNETYETICDTRSHGYDDAITALSRYSWASWSCDALANVNIHRFFNTEEEAEADYYWREELDPRAMHGIISLER